MRGLVLTVILALAEVASGQPTSATKADSGWVPLCNGTDFSGLYDYVSNTGMVDVKTQTTFTLEAGGVIHVKGNPGGYLGTIRQYSHYRVRVDFQWPVGTPSDANSGLLIHLDSA
ncbi:MAG: family 16 glycoside hydrolase, partial [Fibrobacteria bacterium]